MALPQQNYVGAFEENQKAHVILNERLLALEAAVVSLVAAAGGMAIVSNPPAGCQKVLNIFMNPEGKIELKVEGE